MGQGGRFPMSENGIRLTGGHQVVLRCPGKISAGLEQRGELMCHRADLPAVSRFQGLTHLAAQSRSSGRFERAVERVLIEHMHESISKGKSAIGEFGLPGERHEGVHALQILEPLFGLFRGNAQHPAGDRRVELVALHARHRQQLVICLIELPDLAFDHPQHRLRQLALDLRQTVDQPPPAVHLSDRTLVSQIPHDVGHEQRAALGLLMDQRRELGRKAVAGELEIEVLRNLGLVQKPELDLAAHSARLQIGLDLQEGVL